MDQPCHPVRRRLTSATLAAAFALAGCAGQQPRQPPGLLGYGTPDVSTYVPAKRAASLEALRTSCDGVPAADPSATQGLPAACDQLHRTQHNQPGNAVRPDSRSM